MIYFVRHGETEDNIKDLLTGHNDVVLTKKGLTQSEEIAEELKNVKFDICFCSPLVRTKQTCEKLLKHHPKLKVVYDKRIIERDYGEVSGLHTSVCDFNRWQRNVEIPYKNFETVDQVYLRVKNFYDELKIKYACKNVLVVSHSGFGRVSMCHFLGFPKDGNLEAVKIKNAKVIHFEL